MPDSVLWYTVLSLLDKGSLLISWKRHAWRPRLSERVSRCPELFHSTRRTSFVAPGGGHGANEGDGGFESEKECVISARALYLERKERPYYTRRKQEEAALFDVVFPGQLHVGVPE